MHEGTERGKYQNDWMEMEGIKEGLINKGKNKQ